MTKWHKCYARLLSVVLCVFSAYSALASAAVAPNAPSSICIDDTNCASDPPSSTGGRVKWHPGNYAGATYKKCTTTYDNGNLSLASEIGTLPNFKGILVIYNWGCLEGSTAGDYSDGFARIDAYLARLAQQTPDRHLMLVITTHEYQAGDTCNSPTSDKLPQYLINTGGAGYVSCPANYNWVVNFGNAATVDRLIALSKAYAARYDDHPLFESIGFMEETAGLPALTSAGYSLSALRTQVVRLYTAASAQWTHTMLRLSVNYFGSDSELRTLIDSVAGLPNIAFGTGDTYDEVWRSRKQPGSWVFRGLNTAGTAHEGWTDLRGKHPWIAEIQSPDIGAQYGLVGSTYTTLLRTYNWAHGTMRHSHLIWTSNAWQVPLQNSWAEQKIFVSSGLSVPATSSCPQSFDGGCDTN